MTPKVRKALEASIKKWEWNAQVEKYSEPKIAWYHCPLCVMFNNRNDESRDLKCAGCPVFEKTGSIYCDETPYIEAQEIYDKWYESSNIDSRDLFRAAAKREVEFLRSLL